MKVLYDHQIYVQQLYGGISRYFFELTKGLAKKHLVVKNSVVLSNNVYNNDNHYDSIRFLPSTYFKGKHKILKIINEISSKHQLAQDFDVFHPTYFDTYFLKHLKNRPFVITFYDLIHERFSSKFKNLEVESDIFERRKILINLSAKIIAISESTKKDLIEYYAVDPAKIDVIYLASSINPKTAASVTLSGNKYFLYVGSRDSYKNFSFFVNAVAPLLLADKELNILCAGGGVFSKEENDYLKTLSIERQLFQMDINDNTLAFLYINAVAFVFPSLYEGFGLPVLEAFNCSCPVIASNTGSLPEIGAQAALYFDPGSKNDILEKVSEVLFNEKLRNQLIVAGLKRAEDFSWESTVEKHYNLYRSVAI